MGTDTLGGDFEVAGVVSCKGSDTKCVFLAPSNNITILYLDTKEQHCKFSAAFTPTASDSWYWFGKQLSKTGLCLAKLCPGGVCLAG